MTFVINILFYSLQPHGSLLTVNSPSHGIFSYIFSLSRMTQFLRDEASDSEEDVTSLMLDGTYLSRNFATLGPVLGQPPCEEFIRGWDMEDDVRKG